ncbi:uncharacterized protein BO66DRAFT_441160 [Aspergillus aculeatinus CBS 121060]|uniref:Uncharacterized protein n=3 Tax=Aspergillus TaxID=5052 RepID=A0A8G1RX35_9EURO|nr:hypothetical protein BO95DRAFT_467492 [Aspergillus brunneoviolaceus CBS 621.78]XP_025501263.1 hypothetical protein BO66DRAFT_441160 [Aspergillus aculeatinus CBS 121060]XP_040803385.1 uncharacterized protein BO72DRAFT_494238 [Aspergillus fijiensis CBS 313.89]RAH41742.1 hypothetical protein BO95DRAFT_467492 [Aspergillus brunneoviolaceus CBS 621.78]RAH67440.1 hypothetical protein BO66DRAFT_441160 [Aspergillus aculeatinus CBS 121060]RAK79375.1 hypothetical protein BO72DRAFT_494238 [Aspergillus 
MASSLHLWTRSDCDSSDSTCGEKPVSNFLKSGVPGIVTGVIVLGAIVAFIVLHVRNKKRDAREDQEIRKWNEVNV